MFAGLAVVLVDVVEALSAQGDGEWIGGIVLVGDPEVTMGIYGDTDGSGNGKAGKQSDAGDIADIEDFDKIIVLFGDIELIVGNGQSPYAVAVIQVCGR